MFARAIVFNAISCGLYFASGSCMAAAIFFGKYSESGSLVAGAIVLFLIFDLLAFIS